MGKVIPKMHVFLDAFVRAKDEDVEGWVFRTYDDELKAREVETLWQAGIHSRIFPSGAIALIYGRT